MKNLLYFVFLIFIVIPHLAQANPSEVEFTVIRLDYQTSNLKHVYYFQQTIDMAISENDDRLHHGLKVEIVPAGDFGETTIRSVLSGHTVYQATTIWDGTGEHLFPTSNFETSWGNIPLVDKEPSFYDKEDYFFEDYDYKIADSLWCNIKDLHVSFSFAQQKKYGVLAYLHYFSVGANDPTTAEWIFLLYSIPDDDVPYSKYHWISMTNNLPDTYINTAAPHSFYGDSIWIGTNQGAYFSASGGEHWQQLNFSDNRDIKVTSLITTPNPFVNCLCSVIGLGTEEPDATSHDPGGRIFRSLLDGHEWEFTHSPNLAVTALTFNPQNPITMYAGLDHENPNIGGLYRFKHNSIWEKLKYLSDEVSFSSRIHCITIDECDTNRIYIGTEHGLYFTQDNAQTWEQVLPSFCIVSIIITYEGSERLMFAATRGMSRSDGIYLSKDYGKTWDVVSWKTNIVSLASKRIFFSSSAVNCFKYYLAVYHEGVFESNDNCFTWEPINTDLHEKKITCLAVHPNKYRQLYLGTEEGIFKFVPYSPAIDLSIADHDLAYWPPTPKDGELVEIYATVHNTSPYHLFNVNVSFADNADGMLTVIVPIDTLTIPYLLPFSEYTLRAEWYPQGQQGENLIYVHVDPQNVINETDESNNMATIQICLEEPPYERKWQNITYNLPNTWINDIAANPFVRGNIYAATNGGAFNTNLSDEYWHRFKFAEQNEVKVKAVVAEMHPYLDWTVPVIWLGTEEYSDIPEDRLGKVFLSEDGGENWWNKNFPKIAVSAMEAPVFQSLTPYVASYNPFYYLDDYFILQDTTWVGFDLTTSDSNVNRINCFAFDALDYPAATYIGTERGLYIVNRPDAAIRRSLENLDVVSLFVPFGFRNKMVYAATRGESYCDGLYRSVDGGITFEKISDFKNIVSLAGYHQNYTTETAAPHLYLAVYGKGMFESRNGGYSWIDITKNLTDKRFTCLTIDRTHPEIAYLGTENGIYYYDDPPVNTDIVKSENNSPSLFRLLQNYPNPFNHSTVITYFIPDDAKASLTEIKIFNAIGQEVKSLKRMDQHNGERQFLWDGTNKKN